MKRTDNKEVTGIKKSQLNNNSRDAQRARLLDALELQFIKGISTLEARERLNIMHPAGRIKELREAGYNIVTHWSTEPNNDGHLHRVARYVLLSKLPTRRLAA